MTKTVFEIGLSARTDVGMVREHNEDNFILCPDLSHKEWYLVEDTISLSQAGCLLVVADGMGGANAGEVASEIAVESIKNFFLSLSIQLAPSEKQIKEYINQSILQAHQAIVSHAIQNPSCEGMGTTVIVAWVVPGKAMIGWCGDSRGYLFRPGEGLKIITNDHSLVWELVEAGRLSPEQADIHPDSNIITQSLGDPDNLPKPDVIVQPLQSSDRLLLCSDGLNNMIQPNEIVQILGQQKSLPEINKDLVDAANTHGGKDNITVVLLEVIQQAEQDTISKGSKKTIYGLFLLIGFLFMILLWWVGNQKKNHTNTSNLYDTTSADELTISHDNESNNTNSNKLVQAISHTRAKKDSSNNVSKDKSPKKVKIDKQLPKEAIPVDSSSILKKGKDMDEVDERIKRLEKLLKDWHELEKRISAERSKLTKHNVDSVANAGEWLLLDQAQSELDETIKNNKWSEAYRKEALKQQLSPDSFNDFDKQINQIEKTINSISQTLDNLIQKT